MSALTVRNLTLAHGGAAVVHNVSLDLAGGELCVMVGPNGCGKSTLLRAMARLHRPQAGSVSLDGRDIRSLGARQLAREVAHLPQKPEAAADLTVVELVWRGRYPHQGLLHRTTAEDVAAVRRALAATGMEALARRPLGRLSGGEQQRAWLALALAREPRILLLDEPTSSLDISHQVAVMRILQGLAEQGMAVLVVVHDLWLAARFATRVVVMSEGRVACDGPPEAALQPPVLERVFGLPMTVVIDPDTGAPIPFPALPTPAATS